jgi:CheY-like chemotaxis protein
MDAVAYTVIVDANRMDWKRRGAVIIGNRALMRYVLLILVLSGGACVAGYAWGPEVFTRKITDTGEVLMKKQRLLIVDDAINLALLYQEELEDDGYVVDIANSTRNAEKMLVSKTYDLIVMDSMMMDTGKLKEFHEKIITRRNIPIILNTGNLEFERLKNYWGIEVWVMKSSDISSLKEKIGVLLESEGARIKSRESRRKGLPVTDIGLCASC